MPNPLADRWSSFRQQIQVYIVMLCDRGGLPDGGVDRRLLHGVFWSLIGTISAQGFNQLAWIIVARLLGKSGFGEFGMITATVSAFGVVAGLGLGTTATKFTAEWRRKDPLRVGRFLSFLLLVAGISGVAFAVLFVILAPVLSVHWMNAPQLLSGLFWSSPMVLFQTLNGVLAGALAGFESFRSLMKIQLFSGLANFPVSLLGALFFGLNGAVGALLFSTALLWILSDRALRRCCRQERVALYWGNAGKEWAILWSFSLPALLSSLLVNPVLWLASIMLVSHPNGYGELGLVNAANQWRLMLMMFPTILSNTALPILAAESAVPDHHGGFAQVLNTTHRLSVLVTLPSAVFLILFSRWIFVLYGPGFEAGVPVLILVVYGTSISSIGSVVGAAIISKGRMWFGAFQNLTWGVVLWAAVYHGAQTWGALSFGVGFLVSYSILAGWSFLYLRRDLPPGLVIRTVKSVVFIGLIAGVTWVAKPALQACLAFPVIFVALWMTWTLVRDSSVRVSAAEESRRQMRGGSL